VKCHDFSSNTVLMRVPFHSSFAPSTLRSEINTSAD
jgi:hypothetical protein